MSPGIRRLSFHEKCIIIITSNKCIIIITSNKFCRNTQAFGCENSEIGTKRPVYEVARYRTSGTCWLLSVDLQPTPVGN